jgi:5-methylcytosine-specific restriction endonuclease McrA
MKSLQRHKLFDRVFSRHGGRCTYCGIETRPRRRGLHGAADLATLDHVVPRSEGGRLIEENLVLACQSCNNARGVMDAAAFRALKAGMGASRQLDSSERGSRIQTPVEPHAG